MESLASSPEFVYGDFELILDEDNEIAPEGVQQILEVLNTDIEGFNDIINGVFEENNPSDTTTNCEPNEHIDPEPDTKEEPPAAEVNNTRFKKLTDGELDEIEANQYSAATRRNTQWGVRVFNAWCAESLAEEVPVDLATVSVPELDSLLRKFYAEAAPRNTSSSNEQISEYHKNSFKNVRAAINRHFKDIGRDIDIVRDKQFKSSNGMLNAKLKQNLKQGLSRPTQHYPIIPKEDLSKIQDYLKGENPILLRYRVWYLLAIHFVSRGIEFHQQLKLSSLLFCEDESGNKYITISHETCQKNHQGGIAQKGEESQDKRMYATGGPNCPVKAVQFFISKTDQSASALFNHCNPDAVKNPSAPGLWYNATPVKPKQFSGFMPDICKNAGVSRFTAHSLRATSIQALSDAGFEARNIMFMSDHKREESLKSYSRRPSTSQKQNISAVLASIGSGQQDESEPPRKKALCIESCPETASQSHSHELESAAIPHPFPTSPLPHVEMPMAVSSTSTQLNQSHRLAGFAQSSSFSNCTFNISFQQ